MQMLILSRFSPISGPYAGTVSTSSSSRVARTAVVGVCRTGSTARINDAEDNDRSSMLTPKDIKRRRDFEWPGRLDANFPAIFTRFIAISAARFSRFLMRKASAIRRVTTSPDRTLIFLQLRIARSQPSTNYQIQSFVILSSAFINRPRRDNASISSDMSISERVPENYR